MVQRRSTQIAKVELSKKTETGSTSGNQGVFLPRPPRSLCRLFFLMSLHTIYEDMAKIQPIEIECSTTDT